MPENTNVPRVSIHRIEADGVTVFYCGAGPSDAPVVLLLHGFPTSSFQYRELIPKLADRYRVIAPDLPGFGFTEVPEQRHYKYTFNALAKTIMAFTYALHLNRYALYVFDYGTPTGFRVAMAKPERITAIVSQNGNAYEEGSRQCVGSHPALLARPYRAEPRDPSPVSGSRRTAFANTPMEYFRTSKPPLPAIWGKHDSFFIPPGAEAYPRDNPNATVQLLDTGHFALETHVEEIAAAIQQFFAKYLR
jgi:pimeloyl-ACP methyl ester carboxylesterase